MATLTDAPHNEQCHTIAIPDSVRLSGKPSPELIAEAVTFLHRDGILVLENAVDPYHLDTLSAILKPEAKVIARDPGHHFNFGHEIRNMDQAAPLIPEIMYDDVWANAIAAGICSAILGPEVLCHYSNGNTALKATGRQPVHADIDRPHPLYPFGYVLNIPLDDVTAENGATEIWIGSHRDSHIGQHTTFQTGKYGLTIKPEIVESRRIHSPPVRQSTNKGSLIIRDVRLWHAGVPNQTDEPRIMLAFVLQPKWFQAPSKVVLPLKAKDLVGRWERETGIEYTVKWVDGEVDHRKLSSVEADFSTRNKKLLELETLMHPSVG